MTVDKFIPRDAIHPIYYGTSYYMVPDGDAGQDVYVVLRDAIKASGMTAILPFACGLVLHTLHEPCDLYGYDRLFEQVPGGKPNGEMVKLARQLIERQEAKFEPSDLEDRYEARLREMIQAKLNGEGFKPAEPAELRGDNVIDLMAALKRSLGRGKRAGTASPSRCKAEAPAKKAKRAPARNRA
jgi:DNA end-binding protein Ku